MSKEGLRVLLVDNETKRIPQLLEMLESHSTDVVHVDGLSDLQYDDIDHDLIVLSGGTREVAIKPEVFDREIELIKHALERGIPIAAICLGFQLAVRALEGEQNFGDNFTDLGRFRGGFNSILIVDETHPLAPGEEVEVFSSHRRSVRSVPQPLIPIGVSDHGIEIAIHEDGRSFLGTQFHPEEGRDGRLIFDNFMAMIQSQ